jgi:hypothetical protein
MQELEVNIENEEKNTNKTTEDKVEHFPHNISSATEYIYSEELKELREEAWIHKE